MTDATIHVLLSTFNGARHLPALLDSLCGQRDPAWRLLVRDDGSTDASPAMLRERAAGDPRIRIVEDGAGRLGATASFFALMRHALNDGAQLFALCDQDDVWFPDKLMLQRAVLVDVMAGEASSTPALVYSDLAWIDADGRQLADSHFRRARFERVLEGPAHWVLAMNAVPGCAMVGNRALLERAVPAPADIAHHDWWLLALAATCGHVGVVPRATLGYRLHGANLIGARDFSSRVVEVLRSPGRALDRSRRLYWQGVRLAAALEARCGQSMHGPWRKICQRVGEDLGHASAIRRVWSVLRGPVRRIGAARSTLMVCAAAMRVPERVRDQAQAGR